MEKGRGFKVIAVVALCVAIVGISVAFAAMSQLLEIKGTATFDPALWKVRFSAATFEKVGGGSFATEPTLHDTTIESFAAKLTRPGDAVIINFTVSNDGDVPAELTGISKSEPICKVGDDASHTDAEFVCDNLTYTLTYAAGGTVETGENSKIAPKQSKEMVLKLAFNDTLTQPENAVNISNLDKILTYSQAAE